MERFIHRENLALFKKRLAEPCDEAQRQLLLKLLAAEEARICFQEAKTPRHGSCLRARSFKRPLRTACRFRR